MSQIPSQPSTELLLLVGRMDGKLDLMLTQSESYGKRIADLEAWKNKALGIIAAIGTATGLAGSQLHRLADFIHH